jgi:hypothetical protein
MKTVNSLSGGKTSSYLAVHYPADYNIFSLVCIDDKKCQPKDKKLIKKVNDRLDKYGFLEKYGEFVATAEDDVILKVMFDLEQKIGSEIIWVRHNSFEHLIDKKGMLPNMGMRYCTTELKIIPICEFIVNNTEYPVLMNQGIRFDEANRAKIGDKKEYHNKIIIGKHPNGNNKWKEYYWAIANYPLIDDEVLHFDIQRYWANEDIVFPKDSNCVGCFWKPVQQLRKNWDDQTDKMEWFSEQEKRKNHFFKPNIDYDQIKKVSIQSDFNFGTGTGCNGGFCTD